MKRGIDMKKITKEELITILTLHKKWLKCEKGEVKADLSGYDLSGYDLRHVNLSGANLSRASLCRANLILSDLRCVDLSGADLRRADLSCSDLRHANLSGANLTDTILWNIVGNKKEIKSLHIFPEYNIAYTKDRLQIGCKNHSFDEWWNFTDEEIDRMDYIKALDFWKRNKSFIKNLVESYPAE
jgi:uncharacterized protein YjbI with pentapeptide repeats